MKNFIVKQQPTRAKGLSGQIKQNYYRVIQNAFRYYHPSVNPRSDELYGIIYYFFNLDINIDVDNIIKPIWDSLKSFLYHDDYQIKLTIAGSFDLNKNDFAILDATQLDEDILLDLLGAFDTEPHIIYIECGKLNYNLYRFVLE